MLRVFGHIDDQSVESVDQLVRDGFVEPRPAQDRSRSFMHHLADQMFVGGQRLGTPADRAVQQWGMTIVGHRGGEDPAEDRRHVGLAQSRRDPRLHHATQPLWIEAVEHLRHQLRRTLAEPPPRPFRRIGQPTGDRCGDVDAAHLAGDNGGQQEIGAQEGRERVADPILVARHDRRVRDRQPQRVAEQRGHSKPVGQAADHRRLAERLHEPRPGVKGRIMPADEEDRSHRQQQSTRDPPHPDEGWRGRLAGADTGNGRHRRNNPRKPGKFKRRDG
ncbi:hypothetical protein WR25_19829 [Diploscapter pachys]|uniref:Uncharacterized protein n=1 Tax=Diploscapter pachys TaxID=2018661 RepID=A0A2A2M3S3_9BILA|nr:hypothetical protein WR25_19829 [Diploscapter pachys]